jgi:hypothetical protein
MVFWQMYLSPLRDSLPVCPFHDRYFGVADNCPLGPFFRIHLRWLIIVPALTTTFSIHLRRFQQLQSPLVNLDLPRRIPTVSPLNLHPPHLSFLVH